MTTGEFLKRYREAKGLSGRELAFRIDVDQHRMQKWEAGKGNPKAEDADKIRQYFKVGSLQELSQEFLNALLQEGSATPTVNQSDMILKQKDELLAEKDERISDLKRMVNMLEEQLAVYQKKGNR